jgi:HPt (histidine-containing phosphotransfer) domain-containing protein
MKHGDEQARESLPQPGQGSPDRSLAWRQLTYDYLCDLRRQLDGIAGWLKADNHVGIQRFAHRAKGTSGTYGLALIAEKFAQLEQAAGSRPREHVAELVTRIRQLIEAQTEKLRPSVASSGRDEKGDIHG